MADAADQQGPAAALKPGEQRVLIRGNGVKRSEASKSKWRPRYFHLVEVGAKTEGQPAVLTFRWGVDETAMAAGKGKELTITDLSLVEIGTPADGVKWPYPFAADYNTCFKLGTAKRSFHWAAFPAGKASALRAKLSIELLKRNEAEGVRPRVGTMQSLTAAASTEAGRDAVLKTSGWKAAVATAGAEDPAMKAVADELIDSLQRKRELLGGAGVKREISDTWLTETEWSDPAEIDAALDALWELEDRRAVPQVVPPHAGTRSHWVEVRVFVSSSFADMHAEREVLVRKVFPRLRAWAEPRRIRIVECDLRWGVPKGAENETIFRTCLEEVDRCVLVNSQCFFLNMLSERYGWAPTGCDVPDSVIQDFGWTPFSSVTTMEILHAAYRNRNPRALFMFRDPSFAAQLKDNHVGAFTWQDSLAKVALPKLKQRIKGAFPPNQVGEYTCQVSGYDESTGVEKVVLDGLEGEFSERVYSFFVEAIGRAYGDTIPEPLSVADALSQAHTDRAAALADGVVGRDADIASLVTLIKGDLTPHNNQIEVVGDEEVGASAVAAAAFGLLASDESVEAHYHDLDLSVTPSLGDDSGGSSEQDKGTTSEGELYRRFGHVFDADADSDGALRDAVTKKLVAHAAAIAPKRLVLVVEGDDAVAMDKKGVEGVVLVRVKHTPAASDAPPSGNGGGDDAAAPAGASPQPTPARVVIPPLAIEDRRALAIGQLGRYNKKLDAGQLDALVAKPLSGHPGWLVLACEELRVFGVFETVSQKIANLAETMEGLLGQVLERVLEEDDDGTVRRLLGLVAVSAYDLFESELRANLGRARSDSAPSPERSTSATSPPPAEGGGGGGGSAAGAAVDGASSAAGDGAGGQELPYLDWAVAMGKVQPLVAADVGKYTLRSSAVRRIVSTRLLGGDQHGHHDLSKGTLAHQCHGLLVDHFLAVSSGWSESTDGLDWETVRRAASVLVYSGLAIHDMRALKRVRSRAVLFKSLPLGFGRVQATTHLRCIQMAHGAFGAGKGKPKQMPGHLIEGPGYCSRCAMQREHSPLYPNERCCMICGNMVPAPPMMGSQPSQHSAFARHDVHLCHSHNIHMGRSKRCLSCNQVGIRVPAAICHWCHVMRPNRCCFVDIAEGN